MDSNAARSPGAGIALFFFTVAFGFSLWAASVGWNNENLRGHEFRQAQTALSTYYIQQESNFSLAYPTPVLGKPWSIPMEFPLYQWTVVGLSNLTGMQLTPVARLVGLGCFYLTLPAVFILLKQWRVPSGRRWLILGLVVSSPMYIFYARGFLIETMALLLSVWFLLSYLRWINSRKWSWLVSAIVFGSAAGLVKVTTFMLYLIPAVGGTLTLLWQHRATTEDKGWSRLVQIVGFAAAAMVVPLAATFWWMHFADVTKALNPSSQFLVSTNMTGYHFGTSQTRFDSKVWSGHWRIIRETVVWLPLVGLSGAILVFYGRRWWTKVFFCVVCFCGIQLLLPELYAWHDYYYVANALFLLVGMGLGVTTIFDSKLPQWVGLVAVAAILSGQGYHYFRQFYQPLSAFSAEGNDLTMMLKQVTRPDEVLLVQGEDWNAMTPYYARRRALMLRAGPDSDEVSLRKAFTNLKGEKMGALVTKGRLDENATLLKLAVEYFDFHPQPLLKWKDTFIYFPNKRWDEDYDKIESASFHHVSFLPSELPSDSSLAGTWYAVPKLSRYRPTSLKHMHPKPVSFFAKFGLSLVGVEGAPRFGAHPETRLRFAPPPGPRQLRTEAGLNSTAYENLPADDASDGVEIELKLVQSGQPDQVLYSRYLNPRDYPPDRGTVPITVAFEMPATGEVELSVTAGPDGLDRRDWAYFGAITIE